MREGGSSFGQVGEAGIESDCTLFFVCFRGGEVGGWRGSIEV